MLLARLDRTSAPVRLLAFIGLLAIFWLPPYVLIRATVTDRNTVSILAMTLLFIEFVLLLRWWTKRIYRAPNWLRHYGLQPTRQNGRLLLLGFAIGSFSLFTLFAIELSFGWLRWQWPTLQLIRIAIEGLLVAIGVGLGEELIFRGWLLQELERDYRPVTALLANSLIFALLHYTKPIEGAIVTLLGLPFDWSAVLRSLPQFPGLLLLGVLLVRAKQVSRQQLGLAIGLHAGLVWGYYLVNVGELVEYGDSVPQWVTGINQNPLAGVMGMLALVGLLLGMKWFGRWGERSKFTN
ncbi:type II CAAX endopeptidase family protein [Microcoleus sp. FACHB-1515]|uniref:CPBP family intramembrane glutamic endopeptidase n=1 Tax=Cyanophyceae TaxID=3028117 RepID=UPI0018F01676|nr:type II CAAX endopeptidase family protein [Microcoleus sp. FACHB-1515]